MNWSDWEIIMDVAVATLCGALVGVAGSIFVNWLGNRKGYKDIDAKLGKLDNITLSELINQKVGTLQDTTLSGQHTHIEEFISQKVGNLQDSTLNGQHKDILAGIQSIKSEMQATQKKENLQRHQLTGDQVNIDRSIAALSAFSKMMIDLQNESTDLHHQIKNLQLENKHLHEQILSYDEPEQSEDSENTLHLNL